MTMMIMMIKQKTSITTLTEEYHTVDDVSRDADAEDDGVVVAS